MAPRTSSASAACSPRPAPAPDLRQLALESSWIAPAGSAPRPDEQPLEARLGGVVRTALGLPSARGLLVRTRGALPSLGSGGARRVLGLEAEELRPRGGRELVAPFGQEVDRAASPRPSPEVEVEVGEVEQGLGDGGPAARAPAHVDRGLEVHERLREVALALGERGEVQPHRGHGPRVARLLGGRERRFVRGARVLVAPGPLVRDRRRAQGDGFDAGLCQRAGHADRLVERLARCRRRPR